MDELTLEPYAARLAWRAAGALPLDRWQALLAAFLDALGPACTAPDPAAGRAAGPHVLGHIKVLALLPGGGHLRGSKVSARYPADVEIQGAGSGACAVLAMALNVLVYGLPLLAARRIVQEVGQATARHWGVELEVLALPTGHDHGATPSPRLNDDRACGGRGDAADAGGDFLFSE